MSNKHHGTRRHLTLEAIKASLRQILKHISVEGEGFPNGVEDRNLKQNLLINTEKQKIKKEIEEPVSDELMLHNIPLLTFAAVPDVAAILL